MFIKYLININDYKWDFNISVFFKEYFKSIPVIRHSKNKYYNSF